MTQPHLDNAALYRLLVEHSQNAISLHLPDGRFLYANTRHHRLFGFSLEELLHLRDEQLSQLVHPDDLGRTRDEAHEQARRGEVISHLEYRGRRKDGSYVWVEAFATPIFNDAGEVVQILSSIRDISERKAAEQRALAIVLEREKMRLMQHFIQDISHEFRTPLSIIAMNNHMLRRYLNVPEAERKAEQIAAQVQRLTRLVDAMLRMSALESSGLGATTATNLSFILDDAARASAVKYPDRLFNASLPAQPLLVVGNHAQLQSAFNELFDNAFRYTPPGKHIRLSGQFEGDNVVVSIVDEGVGVAEADLARVFDSFWRGDSAHSTPGLGLGLTIARRVIELHGGQIHLQSRVGEGTTVQVSLPIVPQATD